MSHIFTQGIRIGQACALAAVVFLGVVMYSPLIAHADVSHSVATESHSGTTGSTNQSSFSWTHFEASSPEGVLVFVHTSANADYIDSVTYGGVEMAQVAEAADTATEPARTTAFFLGAGVPTGSQTVVVNRTSNATIMYATAVTVNADSPQTEVGTPVLLQENGTYAEQSVDDGSPGTNSLRYASGYSGGTNVLPSGANSTSLQSIDFGSFTSTLVRETTAGQGSRSVGFSYGSSDDRAAVHIAVREVPAPPGVSHGASSESHTGTSGSASEASFSWTHAEADAPEGVVVFVYTGADADYIDSVTYGGVEMAQVAEAADTATEPARTTAFFLGAGVPTGSQTVVVNRTSNATIMYATAVTVHTVDMPNTRITGVTLLENNGSYSEQNVDDGSPVIGSLRYASGYWGGSSALSAGANSTVLQSIVLGGTRSATLAVENTAGEGSRPVGFTSGSDDRAGIHLAISEKPAGIVHSTSSESHESTGSMSESSFSWTHPEPFASQGVLAFVYTGADADYISTVTYGGAEMVQVAEAANTTGQPSRTTAFFLGSGVPAGNQTVIVNRTNNGTIMYASVVTVYASDVVSVANDIVLLEATGTLTEQNVDDGSPGTNSLRYAAGTRSSAYPTIGSNSTLLQTYQIDARNHYLSLARETTSGQGSRPVGFVSGSSVMTRSFIHLALREGLPPAVPPTVTTSAASSVTVNSATLNGDITDVGSANAMVRGFAWGTNSGLAGGDTATTTDSGDYGTGTFLYGASSLTGNTTYYFRAYATNPAGTGTGSILNFLTLPATPGTPTFASVTNNSMTVNWTAPTGGTTSYKLERCAGAGCSDWSQIATPSGTSQAVASLTGNTLYRYRVRATNATGDGAYSSIGEQLTLPATPGTPTFSSITDTAMRVEWTAPTGGAATYKVERCTGGGCSDYSQIASGVATLYYDDTGRTPNTTYRYRVRATNASGDGAYSGTGSQLLLPAAPGTPTFDDVTTTSLEVNWTAPTGGAISYKIERCTGSACSDYSQIASGVTDLFYSDSGLTAETVYRYRVRATNASGDGAYSTAAEQETAPNTPPTVTTDAASSIAALSTTLNGTIDSVGGVNATARGFLWSTDSDVEEDVATTTEEGSFSAGAFSANITDLTGNTTYYYRAYATNSVGMGVGDVEDVLTLPDAPGTYTSSTTPITATGGTITEADGYTIHTFTSGGTFEITEGEGEIEYLVVGGGGGGGTGWWGGGGGSGGVLAGATSLSVGSYTVTVGAGGAANTNGSNSVFGALTALGGGRGGANNLAGGNGGSGGGAGWDTFAAFGSGTVGQGNNGGTGVYAPGVIGNGGGGGGASAAGSNGTDTLAGAGGGGISNSISGTPTFYGGGGGGGAYIAAHVGGNGGSGGGGAGATNPAITGTAGTPNTGGGGGGGRSSGGVGGAGGSGVVVVRYQPESASNAPTFSDVTSSALRVSWVMPVGGADSYKVERCTGAECSDFSQVASGVTTLFYDDSGLSPETVYRYRVRATNATGDGAYSSVGETTTPQLQMLMSAEDQTFLVGDVLQPASMMTITDAQTPIITAANDIRIAIATGVADMRFDTSDTSAVMGGTASAKVSTTVSYEDDGAVLVVPVNTNFDANDTLTISGLSFTEFGAVTSGAGVSALELFTGGAEDSEAEGTDPKKVTIKGAVVFGEHSDGVIDNAFDSSAVTEATLLAFSAETVGEAGAMDIVTVTLSGVGGVTEGDITNAVLYRDTDGSADYSDGDVAVGGAGVVTLEGQSGAVVFSESFAISTGADYIVVADVANLRPGDAIIARLLADSIIAAGGSTSLTLGLRGEYPSTQHIRPGKGGGGGGSGGAIGEPAPEGDGDVGGGSEGGGGTIDPNTGETIGNSSGFRAPTTDGDMASEWADGSSALASDGSYATVSEDGLRHTFGNFGFVVPEANSVRGIAVKLEASASTNAGDISVELSWDGGSSLTASLTTATLTETDAVYTLGGSSNLWERAWTPAEAADGMFTIDVIGNTSNNTIRIDAIQVRIYHQATGGGAGGGGGI